MRLELWNSSTVRSSLMGSRMIAREALLAQRVIGAVPESLAAALGALASIAVPAHQRLDQEDVLDARRVECVVVVRQRAPPAAPTSARLAPAARPARYARRASTGSWGTRRRGTPRDAARSWSG